MARDVGVKTWEILEEPAPAAIANTPQFNNATNIATTNLDVFAGPNVVGSCTAVEKCLHMQRPGEKCLLAHAEARLGMRESQKPTFYRVAT